VGSIRLEHGWDTVTLTLVDQDFQPIEIHEAGRDAISRALLRPGSRSRSERGSLGISQFKSIGRLTWDRDARQPA
jgi:hypothetical protein